MKTILHHYRYDLTKPDQSKAYTALVGNKLSKIGFPVWTMQFRGYYHIDEKSHKFIEKVRASAGPIELDTTYLFDNQWNANELRLFNWAECIYPNKDIREGYWLEQTDEMRDILRNTHKCGYCGRQEPAAKGYTFCPHCLDSEYLREDDLYLLRMVPVRDTHKPNARPQLSNSERDHLLPLFTQAQFHGGSERAKKRIAQKRANALKERNDTIKQANEKYDAQLWIVDNVPGLIGNHIYYTHTDRHCFGWRKELSESEVSALLDVISEFPFLYTIKCADGRTLEN